MAEQPNEIIKVLWTGGWDSTFRVLSLAQMNVVVQPYYLITDRKSTEVELETMARISEQVLGKPSTKFDLRPVEAIPVEALTSDDSVSQAFKRLRDKIFMGEQYEILGWLAKGQPGLELCIHKDDKAFYLIQQLGQVSHSTNVAGPFAQVDGKQSPQDLTTVFGNFHFPVLELSKLDMKEIAQRDGYLDLMNQTWFCFEPHDGKPCGLCNPCKYSIEEGMQYRFSEEALKRYKYRNFINFPKRVVRKLRRTFKR